MSYQPYVDPVGMDPRHYGFADSVKRAFSQYAKFDGVASVAEFWWFYLFNLIVAGVLYFLVFVLVIGTAASGGDGETAGASTLVVLLILGLYGLAVLLPSLGVTIRRLHDAGYSGFFVLLEFVGLGIVTLVLCIFPSKPAAWNPSWLDDEARALQAHMLGGANPYAQGAYGAPMMPEYTQGPAGQGAPYGQGVPQAPYGQPTPQAPYGQGGPQAPYGQGGSAPSSY
jgi:putative membrane protein